MQLTAILMFVACLQVSAASYAQTVSISGRNIPLKKIFTDIRDQTGYNFIYTNEDLHKADRVTLNTKNAPLVDVLNQCFANQPLSYKINDKIIVVKAKNESPMANMLVLSKISGKVTDAATGNILLGVTIKVKGTTIGTTTNEKGEFTLDVPDNAILEVSYIGYITADIPVNGRPFIDIHLKTSSTALNQLVVVGYGVQKKVDLTGSVATVSSKELENRPIMNVSSALTGLVPGAYIHQSSGDPRDNSATIRIRGIGTLNNSAPLVIIDGIPGSIDAVNPNDIGSISFLKDAASAAIYGSRAANGVILITTKKGKEGSPHISYTGIFSESQPMNLPDLVSSYVEHMNLINQGLTNIGEQPIFSQNTIEAWEQAAKNPNGKTTQGIPNDIAYPNTNWGRALFEHNLVQNHNLSVNGGSDHVQYYMSADYMNNPGTMKNTGDERYQLRANIQSEIGKHFTLGTQTFASTDYLGMGNTTNAFNFLRQTTPGVVPKYQGKFGTAQAPEESATANNILNYLETTGGKDQITQYNTTLFANIKIIKGLTLDSKFNYQTWFEEKNSHPIPFEQWNFLTDQLVSPAAPPDQLTTSYSFNKNYTITLNDVLHYNTIIGGIHDIGVMAGYEQYYHNAYNFSAEMKGLIDPSITTLGSATQMQSIDGSEDDGSYRSWFGRINYAYKEKYLFEGNLRYDGSSRFASQSRWGIFPSVSAGWRISEENFFKDLNWDVQNLKLRASWGQLGNDQIVDNNGNPVYYPYQATYGSVDYSFNGVASNGLASSLIANPALKWESTAVTDIGLDATLLRSRLDVTLDYYHKLTTGILTSPPIPLVLGTETAPVVNTASVLNNGFEIQATWQDQIGSFHFSVSGNFAYNFNEVTKYKGSLKQGFVTDSSGNKSYVSNIGQVSSGGTTRIIRGHTINEYYMQTLYRGNGTYFNKDGSVNKHGGPKSGMIRTPEDMSWLQAMMDSGYVFLPVNGIGADKISYGDFIYADNNGDGIYGNSYDNEFTGKSSTPKFNYGLSVTASWNNFDFSMLWAGSAGMWYYWLSGQGYHSNVVRNGYDEGVLIANDHYYYDPANPKDPLNNINAKYPRLKYNSDPQNDIASNFWLYNASYIKLKNIQIGYTLPQRWIRHAWMSEARIFLSGANLFMITKYPGIDPEIGAAEGYPTMKQIAAGVNVTF